MPPGIRHRETYQDCSKHELGLTDDQWADLKQYVDDIRTTIDVETPASHRSPRYIEGNPPAVHGETFNPGGWVGHYPGNIRVVNNRIPTDEEEALIAETQQWVSLIGTNAFEAAFPVSTDLLIDQRTQLAGYSAALIDLTEIVRANRLPVTVNRERRREQNPSGRPVLSATRQLAAQGSREVVTEQLQFSFETRSNYLLIRFHAELARRLQELADAYSHYEDAFADQLQYHHSFLQEPLPRRLLDAALETDFSDPAVMTEVRREGSTEFAEIVDLWEAFQQDRSLSLRLSKNLNTAVKPIHKTYELWCLGVLLQVLTEVTGNTPEAGAQIQSQYSFGSSVVLHYNHSVSKFSKYLSGAFDVSPGEPDFALEVDDQLVWIGDAKFKIWESMKLPDYQRFLTYLVDLLSEDDPATILYVDPEPIHQTHTVRGFDISHLSLRPAHRDRAVEYLREGFAPMVAKQPSA